MAFINGKKTSGGVEKTNDIVEKTDGRVEE
jgi:hypothetical protein